MGGSVTADLEVAAKDDKVTLTIVPKDGYKLASLNLVGGSGSYSETIDGSKTYREAIDGVNGEFYKFTMPAEDITVRATFVMEREINFSVSALFSGETIGDPDFSSYGSLTLSGKEITKAGESYTSTENVTVCASAKEGYRVHSIVIKLVNGDQEEIITYNAGVGDTSAKWDTKSNIISISEKDGAVSFTIPENVSAGSISLFFAETQYIEGNYCGVPWKLDKDGNLTLAPDELVTELDSDSTNIWDKSIVKTITIANSIPFFSDVSDGMLSVFFSGYSKLTSITGLEVLGKDIEKYVSDGTNENQGLDFSKMFSGCSSITTLDLSSWNFKYPIQTGGMFEGCTSLSVLKTPTSNCEETVVNTITLPVAMRDENTNTEYKAGDPFTLDSVSHTLVKIE